MSEGDKELPAADWTNLGYPPDWPKCVFCDAPAMDGHLTCGRASCNESGARALLL